MNNPVKRPTLHLKSKAVIQPKTHSGSPAAISVAPKPHQMSNPNQEAVRAEFEWLRSRWPEAFGAMKPLSIGIGQSVCAIAAAEGRSLSAVRQALGIHTSRLTYLKAILATGAVRITLDGQPAQPVDDGSREHASDLLAKRLAKRDRRLADKKAKSKAVKS
jgi:sRNA-binding protein